MTQQEISVSFDQVQKLYGTVEALKPTSFDIKKGELVTLLGPSGCGKTTTLRLLAGLELASSGKISIGDRDVTHLTATYRNVSMVFQSYALFPHMTVAENTAYGLTVEGVKKAEALQKAEHFLEMVGLEGFGQRLPSELSGGQQQRVAVARAIVLEPEVLLLDEPLSNLDAKLRRHVREEIRQIQQSLGLTALYVTHDQEEAMAVSDQIIVMNKAVIAQKGSPYELYHAPNSTFIADFIGDSNVIDCDVVGQNGDEIELDIGGYRRSVEYRGQANRTTGKLAIRPQAIQLSAPGGSGLKASVTYAAYLGNQVQYTLETEFGRMFGITHEMAKSVHQPGEEVTLELKPEHLAFINA